MIIESFSHTGDISRQSILVKFGGYDWREDEMQMTALLDWEQAAGRPEFWEVMKMVYGIQPIIYWAVLAHLASRKR
jgi:hypothetical protein